MRHVFPLGSIADCHQRLLSTLSGVSSGESTREIFYSAFRFASGIGRGARSRGQIWLACTGGDTHGFLCCGLRRCQRARLVTFSGHCCRHDHRYADGYRRHDESSDTECDAWNRGFVAVHRYTHALIRYAHGAEIVTAPLAIFGLDICALALSSDAQFRPLSGVARRSIATRSGPVGEERSLTLGSAYRATPYCSPCGQPYEAAGPR